MTQDDGNDKVISLDSRRRAGPSGRRRQEAGRGKTHGPGATGGETPPEVGGDPVSGQLIWLFCPTCRTLEYTELALAGGRTHNVCGTQVLEAPVEMDLRAEMTLARINLARLELLESVVSAQRQRYEEYAQRLNLAARRPLAPYAMPAQGEAGEDTPGALAPLPDAEVDALGLLVTPFFRDPAQRFPELTEDLEGEHAADEDNRPRPDGPTQD